MNGTMLRARFNDVEGNAYDIPAINFLMSKPIQSGNAEPRYVVVFEDRDDDTTVGFKNVRAVVDADTARRVEALAEKAMGLTA